MYNIKYNNIIIIQSTISKIISYGYVKLRLLSQWMTKHSIKSQDILINNLTYEQEL